MSTPPRTSRDRAGLSLIEVLVVVAVIGILLGILVPVLGSARKGAGVMADLANVRSLQYSSIQYSLENDGELIEPGLTEGGFATDDIAWYTTLKPYFDGDVTVRSPIDTSVHWPASEGGDGIPTLPVGANQPIAPTDEADHRFRRSSYGINAHVTRFINLGDDLEFGGTAKANRRLFYNRLEKIRQPQAIVQFLLMAESGPFAGADHVHPDQWFNPRFGLIFESPGGSFGVADQMKIDAFNKGDRTPDARSNYGFLDGHAETTRLGDLFESPESNKFDPRLQTRRGRTAAASG